MMMMMLVEVSRVFPVLFQSNGCIKTAGLALIAVVAAGGGSGFGKRIWSVGDSASGLDSLWLRVPMPSLKVLLISQ